MVGFVFRCPNISYESGYNLRYTHRGIVCTVMNSNNLQPNIVVIGGGTGSFTLLSGIKRYTSNITALVNMSDDGGSTGILIDELGVLPPGDVRQCLVALSDTKKVRDLFNYRFDKGSLAGHSFGNLFLSAVEKMTDSFEEAVDVAGDVLRITGSVIPITLSRSKLHAKTSSGAILAGESVVGNVGFDCPKPEIYFDGPVDLNLAAKKAIADADIIVIAPGNLYGSLAPALIVDGVGKALATTKAKIICVANLVTKPGQTDGFSVYDHAQEIERFINKKNILDFVIYNTDEPTKTMYEKYVRDGELMLPFDLEILDSQNYRAVGLPLIDKTPVVISPNDKIGLKVRSLIRHDNDRVAREVMKVYFS